MSCGPTAWSDSLVVTCRCILSYFKCLPYKSSLGALYFKLKQIISSMLNYMNTGALSQLIWFQDFSGYGRSPEELFPFLPETSNILSFVYWNLSPGYSSLCLIGLEFMPISIIHLSLVKFICGDGLHIVAWRARGYREPNRTGCPWLGCQGTLIATCLHAQSLWIALVCYWFSRSSFSCNPILWLKCFVHKCNGVDDTLYTDWYLSC
jgi:hypothetical protein